MAREGDGWRQKGYSVWRAVVVMGVDLPDSPNTHDNPFLLPTIPEIYSCVRPVNCCVNE